MSNLCKIILITGAAESGKDTLADILAKGLNGKSVSAIEPVKIAFRSIGIPIDLKTDEYRMMLSKTGELWDQFSIREKYILKVLESDPVDYLLVQVREPHIHIKWHEFFRMRGHSVLSLRVTGRGKEPTNKSDLEASQDYRWRWNNPMTPILHVDNSKSLEEFIATAHSLIDVIKNYKFLILQDVKEKEE